MNEFERVSSPESKWRKWGPYLSERQWGTVREDYSATGEAWEYLDHDASRKKAYRWGEDGIAGFSDDQQRLCFSVGLWNGKDPILKERLFGLTGNEGNHGEDVKELYYYLDGTPSHSYLKMLYKYPQSAFPYAELVSRNRAAGKQDGEFELIDTRVFKDERYFDVFIEYVKASERDTLIRIHVYNRGPEAADIDLLATLWFRNTWSWNNQSDKPGLALQADQSVLARHKQLGKYGFHARQDCDFLFTENETNPSLFGMEADGYFKDAFHEYVVDGKSKAVNPAQQGTKCAAHVKATIGARQSQHFDFRLSHIPSAKTSAKASTKTTAQSQSPATQSSATPSPFSDFDPLFEAGRQTADDFYSKIQHDITDEDECMIHRQALAGLIWSKQFYNFDIKQWIAGDPTQPPPPESRRNGRNSDWTHLNNADVISMPDKWEYPWYAAWDLAFHCVPFSLIDREFAKSQLILMTREWYMHPNGQIPAYEWAFGDVNPPVHAWAAWRIFELEKEQSGAGDREFLESIFHKLLLNFTWWVNRKDLENRNVFQGGFLGLDNIGVFDRSDPFPGDGHLDQSDGTSWMAMYSLNMLRIALELAVDNRVYEDIATKFLEHFLYIAEAMTNIGDTGQGLWDEEDNFFYDVLHLPSGEVLPLKVRSLVGLTPLFAVETIDNELLEKLPNFRKRMNWFLKNHPRLARPVSKCAGQGFQGKHLLSLVDGERLSHVLRRMLDETEFLSDYGIRGISKYHEEHPYQLNCKDGPVRCNHDMGSVNYEPGESTTGMFGGNSNWRGPIWFPVNYLLIESLRKFGRYYGDSFQVECPTGSGNFVSLSEAADEISRRLVSIFKPDAAGNRAVYDQQTRLQNDPNFKDHILFYEYFHGDTGRGVGASHQTGWTALVASLIKEQVDVQNPEPVEPVELKLV